jgi:hypothetical protein
MSREGVSWQIENKGLVEEKEGFCVLEGKRICGSGAKSGYHQ